MDKQLAQLIADYQRAVGTIASLMSKSGIEPLSQISESLNSNVPIQGELNGGVRYFKNEHGYCVHLPEGEINFSFGQQGEIDEFNEWHLWKFCQRQPNIYAFDSQQSLLNCVEQALQKRMLFATPNTTYYVVDSIKLLGVEAARILATGNALPHRTRDSILMLSSQCFDSANLMFEHYDAVNRLLTKRQNLSDSSRLKFRVYLLSWLGYLHTTVEGFEHAGMRLLLQNKRPESFLELIPKSDKIGKLVKRHANDLRVLRNDIFHLRTDNEALKQFFHDDGKRMEWAKELHSTFASFFSAYRVLAEVEYLYSGRFDESQIRQENIKRRIKKAEKSTTKLPLAK